MPTVGSNEKSPGADQSTFMSGAKTATHSLPGSPASQEELPSPAKVTLTIGNNTGATVVDF
jgi:hypothetical protein